MDIGSTTAPRSDQQNFDDYITGPRTVTITEVKAGSAEQPVEIHLAEYPGRPYKPSKSMRRVLVAAWGPESSTYLGRRMQLVGDPSVKFGGIVVGGIKIGALSNLDTRLSVSLTVSKGKRAPHVVNPLPDVPPAADLVRVSPELYAELQTMFDRKGIPEDQRLAGVNHVIGVAVKDLMAITEADAHQVIAALTKRPEKETP